MSHTTRRAEKTSRGGAQSKGGRGGKGGGRPRQEQPREVEISKALSYLLRHGAKGLGVELDDGGWANLADVLAWRRLSNMSVTLSEIQALVATNDKQRFALKPDPSYHTLPDSRFPASARSSSSPGTTAAGPSQSSSEPTDPSAYLIRASQGHSLSTISSEKVLTPMLPTDPKTPRLVVHGTYPGPWEQIKQSGGLKPMSRKHIHFATNLPAALPPLSKDKPLKAPMTEDGVDVVLSGMRRDATVLIWVDVPRSAQGGVQWWLSANGVVLTEGLQGRLDLEWIAWVERRGTGEILYGTKPQVGAAVLGVPVGDVEGKALLEVADGVSVAAAADDDASIEQSVASLEVTSDRETSKGVADGGVKTKVGAELKDNWDD